MFVHQPEDYAHDRMNFNASKTVDDPLTSAEL